MNEKFQCLHSVSKEPGTVQATSLTKDGRVIRKLEIAKVIAKEPNVKLVKIAAKNSVVYAAVSRKNPVTNLDEVVCRIYDTCVTDGKKSVPYLSYKMYEESEYMPFWEYCDKLDTYENEFDEVQKAKIAEEYKKDIRYVIPIGCHSGILKVLTPTTNKNAALWRSDCREILDVLWEEKRNALSLTNLPLGTVIKLMRKNEEGEDIHLIKESTDKFKHPTWSDDITGKKYKICEIQEIGYSIDND